MRYVLVIVGIIFLFGCGSQKEVVKIESESDTLDSTEYSLIVDEIDFDTWMITNSKRIWFYSHEYYQSWNKIYVSAFNSRVLYGAHRPFNEFINYDHSINYGIELDFKLYWYFMFIQEKYDISLVARR